MTTTPNTQAGRGASARRALAVSTLAAALTLVAVSLILATAIWTLMFVPYAVMGFLVVWQQPRNTVGWALLATGLAFSFQGLLSADGSITGHLPVWLETALLPMKALAFTLLIAVVLLFPDGRVDSRLQRAALILCGVVAAVVAVAFLTLDDRMWSGRANPLAIGSLQPAVHTLSGGATFATVPALLALGLASLVSRWRRSTGVVRQQYRWLGLGATVLLVGILVLLITNFSGVGLLLGPLGIVLLPVAIAVAVTRHGLYDMDRIISRTTSYALVTVVVVTVFTGIILASSRLLHTTSNIAVAAATLTAAAIVQPALRRVQNMVDRRFNRAKYDAEQALAGFGVGLRDQVEPEAVKQNLENAVNETLQPSLLSVWVRSPR
jgi:hypothetical protein